MSYAYVVGTYDTKGDELRYVKQILASAGLAARLIDVSTKASEQSRNVDVDVSARTIATYHPEGANAIYGVTDRGEAVAAMAIAFQMYVRQHKDEVSGLIGIGGSGNTALVAPGMRELPIGTPKFMVSTVASGNIAPYVGSNDIAMIYSVVDVAGLNSISRKVLGNAANALAGTLRFPLPDAGERELPAVGLTMFGVTTPCVDHIVDHAAVEPHTPQHLPRLGDGQRPSPQLAHERLFCRDSDLVERRRLSAVDAVSRLVAERTETRSGTCRARRCGRAAPDSSCGVPIAGCACVALVDTGNPRGRRVPGRTPYGRIAGT